MGLIAANANGTSGRMLTRRAIFSFALLCFALLCFEFQILDDEKSYR
jgi:hypothetical protein